MQRVILDLSELFTFLYFDMGEGTVFLVSLCILDLKVCYY